MALASLAPPAGIKRRAAPQTGERDYFETGYIEPGYIGREAAVRPTANLAPPAGLKSQADR